MIRPAVFSIPAGVSFVDALAAELLRRAGDDRLALARMTVLLPTRRAGRALREAFLRQGGGRPTLLPRLNPLGDVDEDEMLFEEGGGDLDLPPAMAPTRRQLLLTRLVSAFAPRIPPDQAARLAAELARLLDQVQAERLSFDRLADLVPGELAEHWQETLRFLAVLTEQWPKVLAAEGCLDPADRRNRLLERQARMWTERPPADPVIAAGSTGSLPATADLLAVVARLPKGAVVLPGFDGAMDDAVRADLPQSHPQYGMARLLERIGVAAAEVEPWPIASGLRPTSPHRARLAALALRSSSAEDRDAGLDLDAALGGVRRLDAATPREEAGLIALQMREALHTAETTVALVTPDRALARRVATDLARWGIVVDDSAGVPLAHTEPGGFLRLVLRAAAENLAPLALLALGKHPLAAGGMEAARFRAAIRRLEMAVLRGPRPAPGLAGLREAAGEASELAPLLDGLERCLGPLVAALNGSSRPLADLLRIHLHGAEALAANDEHAGAARLWAGEAGEAAAAWTGDVMEAADALGALAGHHYPALFDVLMEGRVVRPRYGAHPRLAIWGPLEARMQHADRIVLGGLNEGTWPPEASASPWMSRPMMARFGLPQPERKIGLSAHDFVQAFAASEVVLTRSARVEGTPTVPSRWLRRLDNVLEAHGRPPLAEVSVWHHWQARLDAPERIAPWPMPRPCPPTAARPRQLSATRIETWMRDPYALYAEKILGLRALKPLDADPSVADYGTAVHQALDAFLRAHPGALPADALDRLLDFGRQAFGAALVRPGVWAFGWPRFRRAAAWFVEIERKLRAAGRSTLATETRGRLTLGGFTLTAEADRIDRQADGGLAIVDYKTGTVPSQKEVLAGYAPQLPLEAAILRAGGFDGVPAARLGGLEYWRLAGGNEPGAIKPMRESTDRLADEALAGLQGLVRVFDNPATPYEARPNPGKAPKHSDYLHLARIKEWAILDEEGET